jgi:predicted nucleic acid-binding protein
MSGMKNSLVGVDTNIFIYFFEKNPYFAKKVESFFYDLARDKKRAVTSIITQIELLSLTEKSSESKLLQLFLGVNNLEVFPVEAGIASLTAELRRKYGFSTPDAIQLATAIKQDCDYFLTNDKRLQKCKEIKVKLL